LIRAQARSRRPDFDKNFQRLQNPVWTEAVKKGLFLLKIFTSMLIIEDEIVKGTNLNEEQLRLEIAVALYEKGILSFGQARRLARMDYIPFEKLLFDRGVPNPYSLADLQADLETLHKVLDK